MRHILFAAAIALPAPAAAQTYQPKPLTAAQAAGDAALLRRALETIHPGLTRYRTRAEIDAALARLDEAAARPTTDLALWRAVAETMAAIRCDHSKAEPSAAIAAWRDTHPTMLPLRFRLIEGRMIVVSADAQPGAPPRGSEIVAINGRAIAPVLARLAAAVSYDGATDQSVAAKLSADSDLTGDDLNEFWPAMFGFADRWQIDWQAPGGRAVTRADLAPIGFDAWTALPWPGEGYRSEFYRAMTWRLTRKTAYLRIDTFVNYRNPVDATALLAGFFRQARARGSEHLILDLRANGGGSRDASLALARHLMPGPFVWQKPTRLRNIRYGDLPDHIDSWGDRAAMFTPPLADFRRAADGLWERIPSRANPDDEGAFAIAPSPDRFAGRLTLLSGPANASGATWTIAKLKEAGATVVGEDTGGSAEGPTSGYVFLLTLPASGLKVRIASAWNRVAIDRFVPGRGVAADVPVMPTLADFAADRDRALDVAKAEGPRPAPPTLAELIGGAWQGVMDYRDFGDDARVTLPVAATHVARGNGVALDEVFDDGPGKTVRRSARWALDRDGATLRIGGERFRIVENRADAERRSMTLVAIGTGREDDAAVDVRLSVVRDGDRLWITRATRRGNAPFMLRHGTVLGRAANAG